MFDVGFDEMLLVAIVAIVVIGPKDLPVALRTAGRWIGKVRRVSGHFRSGIETMIREAELEEMEKKWREQNAAILAAHPDTAGPDVEAQAAAQAAEGVVPELPAPVAEAVEAAVTPEAPAPAPATPTPAPAKAAPAASPELPLGDPR